MNTPELSEWQQIRREKTQGLVQFCAREVFGSEKVTLADGTAWSSRRRR